MPFRLSLLYGSAALLLLGGAAPAPSDREGWMVDYRALKTELEAHYANLSWFASPLGGRDLPALDRRTIAALQQAETDAQARAALLAFQAAFQDAHFVGRALEPASGESHEPERPNLKASDKADDACLALGYGGAQPQYSLPIETLSGFTPETDGDSRPFRSGIMTVGARRIGVIRIPSFSMTSFPSLCRQSWTAEGVDDGGNVNQNALERAVAKAWYGELAVLLRGFRDRRVDAVLVDIGGNGGGDDSGDMATRLFTDRVIRSSPLLVKKGPAAEDYLAEQLEQVAYGLSLNPEAPGVRLLSQVRAQLGGLNTAPSAGCDLSWVWREQRDWAPYGACSDLVQIGTAGGPVDSLDPSLIPQPRIARRLSWSIEVQDSWGAWSGPLYVLMDGKTGSSAEMFAATLQNNGVARLVGVETVGAGCGAMGPDGKVTLPATHLTFSFPTCVRLRTDGGDEVAGVRPDIPVRPTEGESRRARATRLLDLIAREVSEG